MHPIFAAPVDHSCRVPLGLDDRMATTDIVSVQLYVVVVGSTDRQSVLEKRESQHLAANLADQYTSNAILCRPLNALVM